MASTNNTLEELKEELVEGLMSVDNALEPYRMIAHAVSLLGAPELVAAYHQYSSLHEAYETACEQIQAATTAEEVLQVYRAISSQVPETEDPSGG